MALPQILLFRSLFTNPTGSGTAWTSVGAGGKWESDQNRTFFPWAAAGVFRNWAIRLDTAPGAGTSRVFTLQQHNGAAWVDTPLTITISGTATTGSDLTHSFTVAAGTRLRIQTAAGTGTPATTHTAQVLEFEPTTDGQSAYGSHSWNGFVGVSDGATSVAFFGDAAWQNTASVAGVAGVVTALYIFTGFGPATHCLVKNGVVQDGTAGSVNTTVSSTINTLASATFSLPVAPGDTVAVRQVSGGGHGATYGVQFTATTPGEFHVCGNSGGTPALDGVTRYGAIAATAPGVATTPETACGLWLSVSPLRFDQLRTRTGNITNYTITVRCNGADTALSLVHTGTSHTDLAHVAGGLPGNLVSISFVGPSGFSRQVSWGMRGISTTYIPPSTGTSTAAVATWVAPAATASPSARTRYTQLVLEIRRLVLVQTRTTQVAVELLYPRFIPTRTTQVALEWFNATPGRVRVTQIAVEVFRNVPPCVEGRFPIE